MSSKNEKGNIVVCLLEAFDKLIKDLKDKVLDWDFKDPIKLLIDLIEIVQKAADNAKDCLKSNNVRFVQGVDIECILNSITQLADDVG